MDEAVTKDIDLCRERKKSHWERYTHSYGNLQNMHNLSLIASLQSSVISFLMLVNVSHIRRAPLAVIWLSSTSVVFATGTYLKPSAMVKTVSDRDAAYEYGILKCELEALQVSGESSSSYAYRQRYQECYKKKQRLERQYFCE